MHALARDPAFRPSSAAELGAELAGSGAAATRRYPQERTVSSGRRARIWLVGAVLAAALAIALGLAQLGGDGGGSQPPAPTRVAPPARGATAADQARNLARWLRAHSR
jgi:hypothetical protein